MYFAFDPLCPDFFRKIADEVDALRGNHSGTRLHICLLVDGAFDEDFLNKVPGFKSDYVCLYEETPLSGFGKSGLYLVHVDEENLRNLSWISKFHDASAGRPMWSVIVAAIDIKRLAKHLVPFLIAKSDDSLEWPVRWGDVRILPQLIEEFDRKFIDDLFQPVHIWSASSRKGDFMHWRGKGRSNYEPTQYDRLPLSDMTFAKLVERSEPDMVISKIYDRQPELFRLLRPSECYRLVRRQLEIADQFNITQSATRQHFSAMALFLREEFVEMSALKDLLVNVKSGADYMCEIEKLDQSFWSEAEAG